MSQKIQYKLVPVNNNNNRKTNIMPVIQVQYITKTRLPPLKHVPNNSKPLQQIIKCELCDNSKLVPYVDTKNRKIYCNLCTNYIINSTIYCQSCNVTFAKYNVNKNKDFVKTDHNCNINSIIKKMQEEINELKLQIKKN